MNPVGGSAGRGAGGRRRRSAAGQGVAAARSEAAMASSGPSSRSGHGCRAAPTCRQTHCAPGAPRSTSAYGLPQRILNLSSSCTSWQAHASACRQCQPPEVAGPHHRPGDPEVRASRSTLNSWQACQVPGISRRYTLGAERASDIRRGTREHLVPHSELHVPLVSTELRLAPVLPILHSARTSAVTLL